MIEIGRLGKSGAVRNVFFDRYDNPGQRKKLEQDGVRIFGPSASPSQDLEPEYIAVDRNKACVTVQEIGLERDSGIVVFDLGIDAAGTAVALESNTG